MKLLFKQRFFSWFDSYDVYDENDNVLYTVEGRLAWGRCFKIYDAARKEVGMVKGRIFCLLPKFDIYRGDTCVGCISKKFTFFCPAFQIDNNGWDAEGDFFEWDYTITSGSRTVARVEKKLLHFTDTYVIDVTKPEDALGALMVAVAIDADKCSAE